MSRKALDPQNFKFTRSIDFENKNNDPNTANRVSVGRIESAGGYDSPYTINGRSYSETIYVERYKVRAGEWALSVSTYRYGILTDSARAQLKALAESVEAEYFSAPTAEEITANYANEGRSAANSAMSDLYRSMTRTIGYHIDGEHLQAAWSAARAEVQRYMDVWKDGQQITTPERQD